MMTVQVIVPLDEYCPVSASEVHLFLDFLRENTVKVLCRVVKENQKILSPIFDKFGVTLFLRNPEQYLRNNVYVTKSGNTAVICVKNFRINEVSIDTLMKAIDYGSRSTGTPKMLFFPALIRLRDNRKGLFNRYKGDT